jgi:preprotein translocase subunit SecD
MGRDVLQRALVVAFSVVVAVLSLIPTGISLLPSEYGIQPPKGWFTRPIAKGLDISGGVHLVYGVKASEAVKSRLRGFLSGIRSELRGKKIAVLPSQVTDSNTLELVLLSASGVDEAKKLVAENYSELSFVEQQDQAGHPKLIFGLGEKAAQKIQYDAIGQAVETLRNRVDQFGVSEPLIQRSGEDRIILQMPGVSDVKTVKERVGSVAKLEFRWVADAQTKGGIGTVTLKGKESKEQSFNVEDQILMDGSDVADAKVSFGNDGKPEVSLQLTSAGRDTFARLTSEGVGRRMAIILDNVVYIAPVIREPIPNGVASISGGFTTDEAKGIKIVLKSGALPAPLEVLEERTVGPTLGLDSVKKGFVAMGVGFAAIALFMVVYYAKSGFVAVVTLILNAVLMMACLSLFGATLTLPGLAGLALTIGMAVDSNVIIFERIRDELKLGTGRDLAVHTGFDKAFGAIFDANVTTLLGGVILYYFGTGAIRGFAVTLSIGVLTTMFCAVFVARVFFDMFSLKGKDGLSI